MHRKLQPPRTATPADAPSPVSAFRPTSTERNVAHWQINGYPATILIWTAAEWERLPVRPDDAQYYPCGIWCALRMDPS